MYCNESQTELYLEYIKVFFLLLSSDFYEEFAYNGQHDQRKRKGQDGNESSIKDYQQGGIYFRGSTSGRKFDSRLKGKRGWFTVFHVKVTKKVT